MFIHENHEYFAPNYPIRYIHSPTHPPTPHTQLLLRRLIKVMIKAQRNWNSVYRKIMKFRYMVYAYAWKASCRVVFKILGERTKRVESRECIWIYRISLSRSLPSLSKSSKTLGPTSSVVVGFVHVRLVIIIAIVYLKVTLFSHVDLFAISLISLFSSFCWY